MLRNKESLLLRLEKLWMLEWPLRKLWQSCGAGLSFVDSVHCFAVRVVGFSGFSERLWCSGYICIVSPGVLNRSTLILTSLVGLIASCSQCSKDQARFG